VLYSVLVQTKFSKSAQEIIYVLGTGMQSGSKRLDYFPNKQVEDSSAYHVNCMGKIGMLGANNGISLKSAEIQIQDLSRYRISGRRQTHPA